MADALDECDLTLEQITKTPAVSLAGIRAKAEALQLAFGRFVCKWADDFDEIVGQDPEDQLAWSLVRDLLREVAA